MSPFSASNLAGERMTTSDTHRRSIGEVAELAPPPSAPFGKSGALEAAL
jgi:hypothetical protein